MKMSCKKWLIGILIAVLVVAVGFGATWLVLDVAMPDREYLPDLTVSLEDRPGQIVIKEWRFLLGSGAEIYYKDGGKLTLLGSAGGGDDGYCPFADGKYTLSLEENELLIRWHAMDDVWREKRFTLPE